jgi:hypothetical protein
VTLFENMNSTLERSVRILKGVKLGRLTAREREDVYVSTYCNGREKGFAVVAGDMKVAFAEFRSSDCIVVYVGRIESFDSAGNVPNEAVYANKHFFEADKGERAAEKAAAKYVQKAIFEAMRHGVTLTR